MNAVHFLGLKRERELFIFFRERHNERPVFFFKKVFKNPTPKSWKISKKFNHRIALFLKRPCMYGLRCSMNFKSSSILNDELNAVHIFKIGERERELVQFFIVNG